ncbi:MAG: sulfatase-like hydrolase/transferase [Verrucomicrobia bacterium]|nr:sulfatase-like hydrolase/transferase [Verrucomicrobiota bacterium]
MKFLPALVVFAGLLAPVALSQAAPAPAKPNIIFILADDYGVGEVSAYGADNYKTPNIDALARGGTRYTHAYTPSLCGPSRATILTGRYLFRTGATNQDATGRFTPAAETMMPAILKKAGYVTAAVGKWGQLPLGPAEFGFDQYLKFQGSGVYWNTQDTGKNYLLNGKQTPLRDKEYLPDVMHRVAVDFITANHDRPFYLYYSLSHVHTEILPTPDSAPDSKDVYADNVTYMDKLVGKLIAELERQGLREKTMIVFFGDNGTANGRADRAMIGGRRLDGAKGSMLEGGSLEPLIVNWPGVTPAGKVREDMIDSTDFVPTFAEIAGAKLPEGKTIDGRSFLGSIRGEPGQARSWVYLQLAKQWYTREAGWKLTEAGQLYDMSGAPFAEKAVPADTKDPVAIAARQRLQAALDQLNPAGGFVDDGDGTGRHSAREEKRAKKKNKAI